MKLSVAKIRFLTFISFLGILLLSFFPILTVKASFMPPVLPDTVQLNPMIDTMGTLMFKQMCESQGLQLPKEIETYKSAYRMMMGKASPTDNLQMDYLNPLSSGLDVSNWTTLYRSDGSIVPWEDATIGFYHNDDVHLSFAFDSSTGEILNYGNNNSTLEGSWTTDSWRTFQTNAFPLLADETQIITPVDIDPDVKEYLEEQSFSAYALSKDHTYCCIVPNGCTPDTLIQMDWYTDPIQMSGDNISNNFTVFTNDPSSVYFKGSSWYAKLKEGNYGAYGHSFRYVSQAYQMYNPLYNGGWLYCHCPTQAEYNKVISDFGNDYDDDVIYVVFSEPYDIPESMGYNQLKDRNVTYSYDINNNYDYSKPTTINNYPLEVTTTSVPDYSPTFNLSNIYNTIINNPSVNPSDNNINTEDLNLNLPIISNLQKRFPFSIPWDIAEILKSIDKPREAPVIDIDYTFPIVNYRWQLEIDFSLFDDTATLVRTCFLVSFIIGLAVFSYNHFFGS